jgi:hypothetical protein
MALKLFFETSPELISVELVDFIRRLGGRTKASNLGPDEIDSSIPLRIERRLPGKSMLIDAVNRRAVEIKQEDRFNTHRINQA